MGKLSYILGCVTRMDYPELFRTVGKVHKITGKNSVGILADVVKCGLKYGAGFNDYLLCEFYNLTDAQRATYITRSVNNTLVSLLNDREYYHFFDNKSEFYTTFGKYIGRQWLDFGKATQKEFEDFMSSRDTIMVKPDSSSGGFGVNKLSKGDFPSLAAMYQKLKEEHIGVIEDVLQQHEVLNQLNPSSINTLRVVTILNESGPHIVYAHIRIGNSDRPVDNLHSGGMFAPHRFGQGRHPVSRLRQGPPHLHGAPPHPHHHPGLCHPLLGGGQGHVPGGLPDCPPDALCGLGRGYHPQRPGVCGGQQPARLRHSANAAPHPGQNRHAAPVPGVRQGDLTSRRKATRPLF